MPLLQEFGTIYFILPLQREASVCCAHVGTPTSPQKNPPVNFQGNDAKGSGQSGEEERQRWPKPQRRSVMSQEQDSWCPKTMSWLFLQDHGALLSFFIDLFLHALGEKQSVEECFVVSLFSLKLTLHIKHILSPDGLTEWHNHIEAVKPLPLADPTKNLCCGGAEQ